MGLKSLISKIDELKELVDGWQRVGEISAVERDMALERVKRIYEQLRFPIEVEQVVEEVTEEVVEEVTESLPEESIIIEVDEHIELVSFESEPKPKSKSKLKSELDLELEFDQPVFTDDSARKERRRKILSLYDDDLEPQPQSEPIIEPQPEPEPEELQAEVVIEEPQEPIEEVKPQLTPTMPPPRREVLPSLNEQLGFNDRFLMANDLFQGDFEALGSALMALDRCQTINEALIYIAEHYGWSGNNDGAKLLYSMMKSRYTNRE